MQDKNFVEDLKISIRIISYMISAVMFLALILSYFYPDIFLNLSPVCMSKTMFNEECFMCGSSRAFIELSNGNITKAASLNLFSPFLYLIFVFSGIYLLYNISIKFFKNKTFSAGFRKE